MRACIVTGSRKWTDAVAIRKALSEFDPAVVIHGAAAGADSLAGSLAEGFGYAVVRMPAQWERDGKRAGPIRNRNMLTVLQVLEACGYDVAVLAFPLPDSIGTRHMIEIAQRECIELRIFEATK